ncbi:MAG: PIN domain-containing protein [Anaerolineae bacterium]|nr:PIN domain-containing protein [Anaerolineae bacterium]
MTYLLDTDTCVFALRGSESLRSRLVAVDPETIAISVITLAELCYGAACSARPEANHQVVDDFASGISVLGLNQEIARLFGEFKSLLRKQGLLIDDLDLLIAATAHHYRLTLITHNLDHFSRLPGLRLEDWIHL